MVNLVSDIKELYYKQGLSTNEVATKLGVSIWSIISTMRRCGLIRRKPSETIRLKFIRSPKSYQIKRTLTNKEKQLKVAGLMLYWAEGVKSSNNTIDLANSDAKMIRLFISFLKTIYQINEAKLRILLYCYSNQNVDSLINYWVKITGVAKKQFIKPYVRHDYNKNKIHKMPWGLVHVRYNDQRLFIQIAQDIQSSISKMNLGTGDRVVKCTCL